MAFLIANNGPNAGQKCDLKGPHCVMGRNPDCEIVVDVDAVSRQHAKVILESPNYFVQDLNSRNHTFLNEVDIFGQGPQQLADGDLIRICEVTFTFHSDGPKVVFDDKQPESASTITSKINVFSSRSGVQLTASPEAKLNALLEIARNLGKALVLSEVLPQVLNSLFKIFVQADRAFIVLRGEAGQLVPLATKVRQENAADTIHVSRTIVNQVMESKEAILSADATSDRNFETSQSLVAFRIRAMMCAPLLDSEG